MGKDLANEIWEECKETIIKNGNFQTGADSSFIELQKNVAVACYEIGFKDAVNDILQRVASNNQILIQN